MSSPKWEIVNGVKFSIEGHDDPSEEVAITEGVSEESFVYGGSVWDIVREITPEEAAEFLEGKMNPENSKHYSEMTEDELRDLAFGEGIPPGSDSSGISQPIMVSIGSQKFQTPFGMVETMPFLELFWRNTGTDCPEEEEEMKFPDGKTYKVKLSV